MKEKVTYTDVMHVDLDRNQHQHITISVGKTSTGEYKYLVDITLNAVVSLLFNDRYEEIPLYTEDQAVNRALFRLEEWAEDYTFYHDDKKLMTQILSITACVKHVQQQVAAKKDTLIPLWQQMVLL